MKPHVISAFILWVALTAIGEFLAFQNIYPTVGSSEASDFDGIFRFLLIVGVPVFTMVITIVAYSFSAFRAKGDPTEDGPVMRGNGNFPKIWLILTGGLAMVVMIYPGLTGLAKLQQDKTGYGWGDTSTDLTIKVEGQRWSWTINYPDQNITLLPSSGEPIVLPVSHSIRFEGTALDVIHSMWIPAFRMRIDVVPGRTTHMEVTPDKLGDYTTDDAYRLQCSQLCGLDHAKMKFPVKVVSDDDFKTWVAAQQQKSGK